MFKQLFVDYKKHITSDRWKKKREHRIKQLGGKCQRCDSKENLNVHHGVYKRLGGEHSKDLFVLCRSCHELYHLTYGKIPTVKTTKTFIRSRNKLFQLKPFQ